MGPNKGRGREPNLAISASGLWSRSHRNRQMRFAHVAARFKIDQWRFRTWRHRNRAKTESRPRTKSNLAIPASGLWSRSHQQCRICSKTCETAYEHRVSENVRPIAKSAGMGCERHASENVRSIAEDFGCHGLWKPCQRKCPAGRRTHLPAMSG